MLGGFFFLHMMGSFLFGVFYVLIRQRCLEDASWWNISSAWWWSLTWGVWWGSRWLDSRGAQGQSLEWCFWRYVSWIVCLMFGGGQKVANLLLASLNIHIPVDCIACFYCCNICFERLTLKFVMFLSSIACAFQGIMFQGDMGLVPCAFSIMTGLAVFPFASFVHDNFLAIFLWSPCRMIISFWFDRSIGFLHILGDKFGFVFGQFEAVDGWSKCLNLCLQSHDLIVWIIFFPLT